MCASELKYFVHNFEQKVSRTQYNIIYNFDNRHNLKEKKIGQNVTANIVKKVHFKKPTTYNCINNGGDNIGCYGSKNSFFFNFK